MKLNSILFANLLTMLALYSRSDRSPALRAAVACSAVAVLVNNLTTILRRAKKPGEQAE